MRGPARSLLPEDEDDLQIAVADFLRVAWPAHLPWWHTPNGGKRVQVTRTRADGSQYRFSPEAKKLKRMGVLAGVADLCFLMPNGQAAFIELKVDDNTQSDDQVAFQHAVRGLSCPYRVCRSLAEVAEVLTGWLAVFGLRLRAHPTQFSLTAPRAPRSAT